MTKMIKISAKRVSDVVKAAGMNHVDASAAMGASHSYIDKALSNGAMSEPYLQAFCKAFNVKLRDICETPGDDADSDSIKLSKRRTLGVDGDYIRAILKRRGLAIDYVSTQIGASHAYLSNALKENHISKERFDLLCDFLNIDQCCRHKLLSYDEVNKDIDPELRDQESSGIIEIDTLIAFQNLADGIIVAFNDFIADITKALGAARKLRGEI